MKFQLKFKRNIILKLSCKLSNPFLINLEIYKLLRYGQEFVMEHRFIYFWVQTFNFFFVNIKERDFILSCIKKGQKFVVVFFFLEETINRLYSFNIMLYNGKDKRR